MTEIFQINNATDGDKPKEHIEKRGEEEKTTSKHPSSFHSMMVLFTKTWRDMFGMKKVIFIVIAMMFLPLMVTDIIGLLTRGELGQSYGSFSPESVVNKIAFNLIFFVYFWSLGIVFALIISFQAAGIIADEVDRGTMLILVSKPIGRIQIFLGKFLAVFLFGVLISALGIFATAWFSVLVLTGNITHFIMLLPLLEFLFLYSLFINAVFVSITMALSSIMKQGKKVGGVMIAIIAITYLIFMIIRMAANVYYIQYYLYYLDIGYHLTNVFVYFIEITQVIPSSSLWQGNFSMFFGIFEGGQADSSQGISLGGMEVVDYVSPLVSLYLWLGITLVLLVFGLLKLKKKEISN